jgi:hypothetical protein
LKIRVADTSFLTRHICGKGAKLAKPNFQFQKRQKELEKKRKQEEKRQRKLAAAAATQPKDETAVPPPEGGETQGNT